MATIIRLTEEDIYKLLPEVVTNMTGEEILSIEGIRELLLDDDRVHQLIRELWARKLGDASSSGLAFL